MRSFLTSFFLLVISVYASGQGVGIYPQVTALGTDTYTASYSGVTPAPTSYVTGARYQVKFTNANTIAAPTVNLNSLGAKTIFTSSGAALSGGTIAAGDVKILTYDGVGLRMLGFSWGGTLTGDVQLQGISLDITGNGDGVGGGGVDIKSNQSGTVNIELNTGADFNLIDLENGQTINFGAGNGLTELLDYSSTYTNTSYVNKAYVNSLVLRNTAVLDFPSTGSTGVSNLTITVTGASVGDPCTVGVPNGSVTTTGSFWCWVSSSNTVTIRFSPKATEDPASGTFKVSVFKY